MHQCIREIRLHHSAHICLWKGINFPYLSLENSFSCTCGWIICGVKTLTMCDLFSEDYLSEHFWAPSIVSWAFTKYNNYSLCWSGSCLLLWDPDVWLCLSFSLESNSLFILFSLAEWCAALRFLAPYFSFSSFWVAHYSEKNGCFSKMGWDLKF